MRIALLTLSTLAVAAAAPFALAHCEIPCGIYGDRERIVALHEDLDTVAKSMTQITEIGGAEKPDWNQLVRWTLNKETHADRIQETVTQYFMTQRVKVPAEGDAKAREKYVTQLTLLHELLVAAMKMKQTTDPKWVEKGRDLVDRFAAAYLSDGDRKHLKEHHGR